MVDPQFDLVTRMPRVTDPFEGALMLVFQSGAFGCDFSHRNDPSEALSQEVSEFASVDDADRLLLEFENRESHRRDVEHALVRGVVDVKGLHPIKQQIELSLGDAPKIVSHCRLVVDGSGRTQPWIESRAAEWLKVGDRFVASKVVTVVWTGRDEGCRREVVVEAIEDLSPDSEPPSVMTAGTRVCDSTRGIVVTIGSPLIEVQGQTVVMQSPIMELPRDVSQQWWPHESKTGRLPQETEPSVMKDPQPLSATQGPIGSSTRAKTQTIVHGDDQLRRLVVESVASLARGIGGKATADEAAIQRSLTTASVRRALAEIPDGWAYASAVDVAQLASRGGSECSVHGIVAHEQGGQDPAWLARLVSEYEDESNTRAEECLGLLIKRAVQQADASELAGAQHGPRAMDQMLERLVLQWKDANVAFVARVAAAAGDNGISPSSVAVWHEEVLRRMFPSDLPANDFADTVALLAKCQGLSADEERTITDRLDAMSIQRAALYERRLAVARSLRIGRSIQDRERLEAIDRQLRRIQVAVAKELPGLIQSEIARRALRQLIERLDEVLPIAARR